MAMNLKDYAINGISTIQDSLTLMENSGIQYQAVSGDVADRFTKYRDEYQKWADPLVYRKALEDNGNNIKYVINPTKEDYVFALVHGAIYESVKDHVTIEDLNEYKDKHPHEFI